MPKATNAACVVPATKLFDEAAYRTTFRHRPYYSTGRDWTDYAPAYRYGHEARSRHVDCRFGEIEQALAEHWDELKAQSRLVWAEARGAVLDAWERGGDLQRNDKTGKHALDQHDDG